MASCIEIVINTVASLSTLAAVILALKTSSDALDEVRKDRILGQSPFLAIQIEETSFFVINKLSFGELTNFGKGAAIGIKCKWILTSYFFLDERKEVSIEDYGNPIQRNLLPEATTYLNELPIFLWEKFNDYGIASGVIEITYNDSFGNKYLTRQKFTSIKEMLGYDLYLTLNFHEEIEYVTPFEKT